VVKSPRQCKRARHHADFADAVAERPVDELQHAISDRERGNGHCDAPDAHVEFIGDRRWQRIRHTESSHADETGSADQGEMGGHGRRTKKAAV
jgi:hypothetical protein